MNIITKKATLVWRNPYILDGLVWIWSLNQLIPLDNVSNEGAAIMKSLFDNLEDITVDVAYTGNDLSASSAPMVGCKDYESFIIVPRDIGPQGSPNQRPRIYAHKKQDYTSIFNNRRLALSATTNSYTQCFGRDDFHTVATPERTPSTSSFTITDSSNPDYRLAAVRIYNRILSYEELIANYDADISD